MALDLFNLLFFPAGLGLIGAGLLYQWADRKLLARFQNRLGPRWFQPFADAMKLLGKEEISPQGSSPVLFAFLPMLALAGALTAALYVPLFGLAPVFSFPGDLIVTLYLMSLLTMCIGLAGAQTRDRFSLAGALRVFTQMFAYEAPFILALLTPSVALMLAGQPSSWQISELATAAANAPVSHLLTLPITFVVALVGLMGKLELPPFDAPEAETEIVAGALTEYSGRGLALFSLARAVELVVGLTLVTALYLGGVGSGPLAAVLFTLKTIGLLVVIVVLQTLLARLRIDQTVNLWWRIGSVLVLAQWLLLILYRVLR
ncbi:MAG: NADH-quinone oxidoreductase subunit H [Candidatus Promineofilum sp.]|nr:NADH-quinone oxidoreductase subunit H [Promineifilum sp.]MCW5861979.1 NADH-quinone oxidoreductase subunit H [Anaerolineae bacterium]